MVLGHRVDVEAAVGEFGHQFVGGGEGESQFLDDVGAGVVEEAAIDGEDAEFGQVLLGIVDQLDGLVVVATSSPPQKAPCLRAWL